ncbi:unnamed protein product, partial [Rotaria sordida]
AARVQSPVPREISVTALSKSNIKSDEFDFDQTFNSLQEFCNRFKTIGC